MKKSAFYLPVVLGFLFLAPLARAEDDGGLQAVADAAPVVDLNQGASACAANEKSLDDKAKLEAERLEKEADAKEAEEVAKAEKIILAAKARKAEKDKEKDKDTVSGRISISLTGAISGVLGTPGAQLKSGHSYFRTNGYDTVSLQIQPDLEMPLFNGGEGTATAKVTLSEGTLAACRSQYSGAYAGYQLVTGYNPDGKDLKVVGVQLNNQIVGSGQGQPIAFSIRVVLSNGCALNI